MNLEMFTALFVNSASFCIPVFFTSICCSGVKVAATWKT